VLSVAIAPERRRCGNGAQLLHAVVDEFKSNGVTWIGAIISEDNVASQTLFQEYGFVSDARIQGYYEPNTTVLRYMRRGPSNL
jgi:ribosomal protein S18 acetylase RimI-like enzyme